MRIDFLAPIGGHAAGRREIMGRPIGRQKHPSAVDHHGAAGPKQAPVAIHHGAGGLDPIDDDRDPWFARNRNHRLIVGARRNGGDDKPGDGGDGNAAHASGPGPLPIRAHSTRRGRHKPLTPAEIMQ